MIGWLLACQRAPAPDPALVPLGRALAAWEEGERRLAAGDVAGAQDKLAEASAVSPSPLLTAWEAKAKADGGDVEGAIALLDRALTAAPDFSEARYNRAAYLARLDRPEEAAAELGRAIQGGASSPLAVLEDPDFARLLGHPAFEFLPREALSVAVVPPSGPVFWGAEVALRVELSGLVRDPVQLSPRQFDGPLQLLAVTEDVRTSGDGPARALTWTWKAVGAGPIVLGPTGVGAGKYRAQFAAIELAADAPPDVEVPTLEPLSLPTARALLEAVPERTAALVPGRGPEAAHWVAHLRPGDRASTEPTLPPPARLELREDGTVTGIALRWPAAAVPTKVILRDADGVVVYPAPSDTPR